MEKTVRATKKQRELLAFIDTFIKGNSYGPSYREIMRALGYKSVSTVAVHVDGLIKAGYIRKKDNSARSIEVLSLGGAPTQTPNEYEVWLQERIQEKVSATSITNDQKLILVQAAEILGLEKPALPQ